MKPSLIDANEISEVINKIREDINDIHRHIREYGDDEYHEGKLSVYSEILEKLEEIIKSTKSSKNL